MRIRPLLGFIAAGLMLPAYAQQGGADSAAARDALKKQEGDTDQTSLLKQTLTAVDKQYTLIKRGKIAANYELNYSYVGQERINADLSTGQLTLFEINNDSAHQITNTLSVDYGVRDNVTASVILPVVSKYSENPLFDGLSHSLGDIGVGARFQPFETKRGKPSLTVTTNLRLPTGKSPFKVDARQDLATGSGVASLTAGVNVNHIVDPVALFGSLNLTISDSAKDLEQLRGTRVLTKVEPGESIGFGLGFAYALSYGISTSISIQESISRGTKLFFRDGSSAKTKTQTSGMLNMGIGYRISPKTTLNITAGIGLTTDSPDFTLGLSMPLSF